MKSIQKQLDPWLFIPFMALSVIGVIMVWSSSASYPQGANSFMMKQFIFAVVGIILAVFVFARMNLKLLRSAKVLKFGMWALIVLLVIARLAPESAGTGAHGWINLPLISIQPAEIAKLAFVVYLSDYLTNYMESQQRKTLQSLFAWQHLWTVYVSLVLIIMMPDIGNALIALALIVSLLLASGFFSREVFAAIIAFLSICYAAIPLLAKVLPLHNYQIMRLVSFVNPWGYLDSSGSQLINAYYAIANGGWFGVGLGNSIQKMGYLPEANTDFIIAIVSEELGAFFTIGLIGLVGLIIGRLFYLGLHTQNNYRRLMMYGIATFFAIQTIINVSGVSGLLPITGVTFPFVSYGGSSFLISSAALGLALNLSNRERLERQKTAVPQRGAA